MELEDAQNRLKALTASSTAPTLSDAEIDALLDTHSLIDLDGYVPTDPDWENTYNFNAAAHEGWLIKAGRCSDQFDFGSDVHTFTREQVFKHCMEMADKFASKRMGTMVLGGSFAWPPVIGNLNDV